MHARFQFRRDYDEFGDFVTAADLFKGSSIGVLIAGALAINLAYTALRPSREQSLVLRIILLLASILNAYLSFTLVGLNRVSGLSDAPPLQKLVAPLSSLLLLSCVAIICRRPELPEVRTTLLRYGTRFGFTMIVTGIIVYYSAPVDGEWILFVTMGCIVVPIAIGWRAWIWRKERRSRKKGG